MSQPGGQDAFRSGVARRDEFLATVPSWYRGWVHFGATMLVGASAIVLVLRGLAQVRAVELLALPLTFLVANYFEWWVHRGPLHHRGLVAVLYDRHTLLHHASFSESSMAIRSPREMRMVLFPFPALVGAALIASGLGLATGALATPNAGRLVSAVALGYYLLYEVCHLSFHMPASSLLGRNPVTRWLRVTHTRHHDPSVMLRRNFNVTFPICDALLGTLDRGKNK